MNKKTENILNIIVIVCTALSALSILCLFALYKVEIRSSEVNKALDAVNDGDLRALKRLSLRWFSRDDRRCILERACFRGHFGIIQYLILKWKINPKNMVMDTDIQINLETRLLEVAAIAHNLAVFQQYLNLGYQLPPFRRNSLLRIVVGENTNRGDPQNMIKFLVEDMNINPFADDFSILNLSVQHRSLATFRYLLSHPACILTHEVVTSIIQLALSLNRSSILPVLVSKLSHFQPELLAQFDTLNKRLIENEYFKTLDHEGLRRSCVIDRIGLPSVYEFTVLKQLKTILNDQKAVKDTSAFKERLRKPSNFNKLCVLFDKVSRTHHVMIEICSAMIKQHEEILTALHQLKCYEMRLLKLVAEYMRQVRDVNFYEFGTIQNKSGLFERCRFEELSKFPNELVQTIAFEYVMKVEAQPTVQFLPEIKRHLISNLCRTEPKAYPALTKHHNLIFSENSKKPLNNGLGLDLKQSKTIDKKGDYHLLMV